MLKLTHPLTISLIAGSLTAMASSVLTAVADNGPATAADNAKLETAIFAGGCFWCVESDFDKLDGVLETVSGYTAGNSTNPTYKTHTKQGHLEAVKVVYDSSKVEYGELVDYFVRHIDPTDDGGQFCDRGNSYPPPSLSTLPRNAKRSKRNSQRSKTPAFCPRRSSRACLMKRASMKLRPIIRTITRRTPHAISCTGLVAAATSGSRKFGRKPAPAKPRFDFSLAANNALHR